LLGSLDLEITRDTDITRNVLNSCDEVAAQRVRAFPEWNAGESSPFVQIREFLGVSDSFVYQKMRDQTYEYRILWLRKRGA
jgi:hypothetical protein